MLEAWLGGGVRHVLGPLFDLPDRLGRLFADAFYAALLSGETIGESVRLARLRLVDRVGAGSTPWGAYVLYGEPDLAYFEPDAEHASPDVTPTAPTRLRPVDAVPVAEVMRAATHAEQSTMAIVPRRGRAADWVFFWIVVLIVALTGASIGLVARSGPAAALQFDGPDNPP